MQDTQKNSFDQLPEKLLYPSVVSLEKDILAASLNDEAAIFTIVKLLKPYHLTDEKNQLIYKAILQLFNSNEAIDSVSVIETLKKLDLLERAGNAKYISSLNAVYVSSAKLQRYCRIILEKWILRELIAKLKSSATKAQKEIEDPFDLLSGTINDLEILQNSISNDLEEKSFDERLPDIITKIKDDRENGESSTIKAIDFPSFNNATGGLNPGNLLVISGKYKSGKTRFSLSLLRDFAVNSKIPIGLIGFEMDQDEYDKNLLSMQTGVRYGYLRNPAAKNKDGSFKLRDDLINELETKAEKYFKDTKIFINDRCITDTEVISKIKFWVKKHHLKVIAIDYLQLIETNGKFERRDLEIANITKRLKNVAWSENIAIIVLVQENEAGQSADSKGPLRDADFWFSIAHPIDEPSYYIDDLSNGKSKKKCVVNYKDHLGVSRTLDADQSLFHLKFKASRHSANGKSFLCKFFENGEFKELSLDPEYNQENLI